MTVIRAYSIFELYFGVNSVNTRLGSIQIECLHIPWSDVCFVTNFTVTKCSRSMWHYYFCTRGSVSFWRAILCFIIISVIQHYCVEIWTMLPMSETKPDLGFLRDNSLPETFRRKSAQLYCCLIFVHSAIKNILIKGSKTRAQFKAQCTRKKG